MTRSAALIPSSDGKIALIERVREGQLYYVFPGGGTNRGETPIDAMIREVFEELGLRVEPDRLIAQVTREREEQYYYLARVIGGQFGTGTGSEILGLEPPERGTYRPVWMPFHQLNTLPGWPSALFHIVARVPNEGWPESPLQIVDNDASPDAGDFRAA